MIEFARQYVAKDWHIFPITPKQKAPPLVKWREESSNDPEKIKAWPADFLKRMCAESQ
jgi:hypothetical protein